MRELSLFTGAGGGLLGTKLLGWRAIGYVEANENRQEIIKQRILDGLLDAAPIFGDVRKFITEGYAEAYRGVVDIVTAGVPCGPASVAGQRQGGEDDGWLWPETIRILDILRPPRGFLLENPPGILSVRDGQGRPLLGRILGSLAKIGFYPRWDGLSAAHVGAPHSRDRIWFISNPNGFGRIGMEKDKEIRYPKLNSSVFRTWRDIQADLRIPMATNFSDPVCGILRNDDGLAEGMGRIEACGFGQVPAVVKAVWELLGPSHA